MYLHHNFVFIGCGIFQWRVLRRRQSNVIRHAFAFSIAHRSDHIGEANRPRRIGATAYERGRLSWRPLSFRTARAMSAFGTKRTFKNRRSMSAFGGIADIPLMMG